MHLSLSQPGAVAGEGIFAQVAAHLGDPMGEQRAVAQGSALVDLSDRAVITIAGADRRSWLNSLTTQELKALPPEQSAETLILTPKGHIEFALHVVDRGDILYLTSEPGTAPAIASWLDSMRFMLDVTVTDQTGEMVVLGGFGEHPEVDAVSLARWRDPWPNVVEGGIAYGPVEGHPGAGWNWSEYIIPGTALEALRESVWAGRWAWEALRIAAWRPVAGQDSDHRAIPHELDWLRTAVHLNKGCYRGQETIARVHNLGQPPRRLAFVHLDGSEHELPVPGAPVTLADPQSAPRLGERPIGELTSIARHYEDGPIGLVLLKRSAPGDVDLRIDQLAAAQTPIVQAPERTARPALGGVPKPPA